MGQPIAAVFFDFDHTLGVDNRLEERALRAIAVRHCMTPPDDAEVATVLRRFRTEDVALAVMLNDAFESWGYRGDVVAEYKAECLSLLPDSLTTMPGAKEILHSLLDRSLTVAILTNGWTELQRAKAESIGFNGPVIVSEEIGAWKPDRRAFEIACQRLDVDVARSMYVGDSPMADVAGSKNAGMIATWARLEGQTYPDDLVKPDFTITRLDELLDICARLT
jgi:HAD superfamily hydrolase (TIGR01549 family)